MEIIQSINWLDIAILLLLIRGIYLGIKTGLTSELFRFIGTALSLTLAVYWYSQAADILIANLDLPTWLAQFLCFTAITQLIGIIFRYTLILLLKVLNIQFVPPLEKPGGGLVGLARAVIVSGTLVLMLGFFPSDYLKESIYEKSYSGSFLVEAMQRTYQSLTFWLPEEDTERDLFAESARRERPRLSGRRE